MPWVDLFDHIHVAPTQKGKPRILCSIYTNSEDGSIYKAQGESKPRDPYQRAQWLTWGNKCDRFIFWTDAPLKKNAGIDCSTPWYIQDSVSTRITATQIVSRRQHGMRSLYHRCTITAPSLIPSLHHHWIDLMRVYRPR